MEPSAHVPLPAIRFDGGTPVSDQFGDVYFSRSGGVAETTHVFLQGNGLPERWAGRAHFTLAELGFGTGLNFLTTWQAFLNTPGGGHLHYLALEQFPLTPEMLQQAYALQPALSARAAQLSAQWPARLPGWHRLHFPRVTLTLGFGEASALLPDLYTPIDAWFLDGFSPAKNPALWTPEIFAQMARASAPDATFATFTAARAVRQGLQEAGFAVRKVAGYGRKRDMLIGSKGPEVRGQRTGGGSQNVKSAEGREESILVIGGGIAGCSLARALAERGRAVTLLSRDVADGASGNEAAVLFPQLSKRWLASTAWFFAAEDFARRRYRALEAQSDDTLMASPGILRLPRHADEETALRRIHDTLGLDASIVRWVEAGEASERAGVPLATGAAFLPQGSWVRPSALCRALLQHPRIETHINTTIARLEQAGAAWRVHDAQGVCWTTHTLCLANAQDAAALLPTALPLSVTAGQVSRLHAAQTRQTLHHILCHKGYVIPQPGGTLIGATYDRADLSGRVTDENHAKNLHEVAQFLPGWIDGSPVAGRTSLRATTPDRLPYVGPLAPGLWLSLGHGSRGMISAPLAAEIIASAICGEASPVSPGLCRAVDPRRMLKQL